MRAIAIALVTLAAAAACNHPRPTNPALQHVPLPGASAATSGPRLRLVTFNVHMIEGAAIATAIRTDAALARADVIALQEVTHVGGEPMSRACVAAVQLGMHCAFAPGYGTKNGGSHGVALLSRLPLADVEMVELPFNHTLLNSGRRVALGATVDVAGTPVRIYSVHLDARINPAVRKRQLRPVLDAADRRPIATAIAGDMNTSPFVWIGRIIPVPAGVQDSRLEKFVRARGFATPTTSSGPTSQWLAMQLDAVYTRGLAVVDQRVEHGVRVSDHLPLWTDLVVADTRDRVAAWRNGRASSSDAATRKSTSSRP